MLAKGSSTTVHVGWLGSSPVSDKAGNWKKAQLILRRRKRPGHLAAGVTVIETSGGMITILAPIAVGSVVEALAGGGSWRTLDRRLMTSPRPSRFWNPSLDNPALGKRIQG